MFKSLFIICLTVLQIEIVFPQTISRQPLANVFNWPTRETVLEPPRSYFPQYNPLLPETAIPPTPIPIPSASPVPAAATTVITDCSPSVCKNLANTLQLMIVCNLLQNTQGGSDLAVQLAAPIINEVISSPNFSCGCANPLYANPLSPPTPIPPTSPPSPPILPPNVYPNMIPPNIIPNYINTPVINSNGFLFNLG